MQTIKELISSLCAEYTDPMSNHASIRSARIDLNEAVERLQEQNKILKEALGFYANKESWSVDTCNSSEVDCYRVMFGDSEILGEGYAGKSAREALKKLEEMERGE